MKPRSVLIAAFVAGAASVAWWSCSGEPSEEAHGSDAGGAGNGGAAGAAGGAGGVSATGGTGGVGNTGGVDWGPAPKWEAANIAGIPCPVERLANATEIRMFSWEPCPWASKDCEQAVLNSAVMGTGPAFGARVDDDGANIRVVLGATSPKQVTLFALENGAGLAGFRPEGTGPKCILGNTSIRGDRFASLVAANVNAAGGQFGGILGELGTAAQSATGFTSINQPPGGPQGVSLGITRWLWWWAPTYAYTSVSALDGSDYKPIATTMPPSELVYLGPPVATGKTFLFDAVSADDAGLAHGKILYSDGVSVPQVYLEPSEPDTHYGRPIYANSYVGFFKGIGLQDVNQYGSVELWSSPYSDDPSQLKPTKLAVLPYHSMPGEPAGGWGFALIGDTLAEPIGIWDLAKATERTYPLSSDTDRWMGAAGVTRQHAWVVTANFTWTEYYLLRFRNE
jgi:hypothetical protein